MKLLRETVRKILLEAPGMNIIDDLPDGILIVIKKRPRGYALHYAHKNNIQREPEYPKGYIEIDRPNSDTGPCDGAFLMNQIKASQGWGPFLCDIAIEFATQVANGLAIDRYYVSEEAESMWSYYQEQRSGEVKAHQLDDMYNTLTPTDNDNAEHDNVATDLDGNIDFDSTLTKRYTKEPTTMNQLANRLVIL